MKIFFCLKNPKNNIGATTYVIIICRVCKKYD